MKIALSINSLLMFLFYLQHLSMCTGTALHYFSTFEFGKNYLGPSEHLMKDFITLANDPKEDLPNSFTICSSFFVKFVVTTLQAIKLLKKDGSQWFDLILMTKTRDHIRLSETMVIHVSNPQTKKHQAHQFTDFPRIPIVPHSWYHICMGLDTESGLLRVVVNGVEVANEEKDFFKNTTSWKPRSVEAKITQFKAHISGLWMQTRHTFSNMHIFSSMMSMENMKKRTSDNGDCSSPGDYLR